MVAGSGGVRGQVAGQAGRLDPAAAAARGRRLNGLQMAQKIVRCPGRMFCWSHACGRNGELLMFCCCLPPSGQPWQWGLPDSFLPDALLAAGAAPCQVFLRDQLRAVHHPPVCFERQP